jgi:hypothetical protein
MLLPSLQPGDLIAFYGDGLLARAIQAVTLGGPCHVAIVCHWNGPLWLEGRKVEYVGPLIVESTSLCPFPCAVRHQITRGVQAHAPRDRLETYPGHTVLHRLLPDASLCRAESRLLTRMLERHWIGKKYDYTSATLSPTHLLKHLRRAYPDPGSIFCSALLARLYMRLGRLPWGNAWTYHPGQLLHALRASAVLSDPITLT